MMPLMLFHVVSDLMFISSVNWTRSFSLAGCTTFKLNGMKPSHHVSLTMTWIVVFSVDKTEWIFWLDLNTQSAYDILFDRSLSSTDIHIYFCCFKETATLRPYWWDILFWNVMHNEICYPIQILLREFGFRPSLE